MNLQTKQRTLAMMTGFERYTKKTRRAAFLEEMEQVVPWRELCALVEPHYPKGGSGRPPIGVERMLRIYFLQQWFNLSDPGIEEALYDSAALRQFVGIDLGREPAPDETTVCKFRHLLEEQQVEQQNAGDIRRNDPVLMARFVWALVHGTAMLFIDGQLPEPAQREALEPYVAERIYVSIRQSRLRAE